jgi:segregation and condensation protein B
LSEIEEKDINDNDNIIDDNGQPDTDVDGEAASPDIGDNNGASGIDEETESADISDIGDDNGSSDIDEDTESADISDISDDNGTSGIDGETEVELFDDGTGGENVVLDEGVDGHRILEALIFASNEMLTPAKLKTLVPGAPDAKRLRRMVAEINERLEREDHPFEIVEAGGGYQFRTLALYHPWVRTLHSERTDRKLSLQALECLAIIAYRQPISKAEVEAVRGVLSDGAMKTLLEKKLVDICGRSEKPGRPLLYATTNDFLRYFGINKITDLPRIEEFEALAKAQMEEMSTVELGEEQNSNEVQDGGDIIDKQDDSSEDFTP